MPQVDLETLVSACAGGGSSMDRKIACETLADAAGAGGDPPETAAEEQELPPDYPPGSFWLSKDAEFDWFDRNAFFERKDSQKGNNSNLNVPGSNSNSNSQRFSKNLKSKAAIIGLPKTHKNFVVDAKSRKNCRGGGANGSTLFPRRSCAAAAAGEKPDGAMIEPSSPKVSCMGRVRSRRDRKRRSRKDRRPRSRLEPEPEAPKPAESRRTGFFASFRAIFRGRGEKPARTKAAAAAVESTWSEISPARRSRAREFDSLSMDSLPRKSLEIEPPGLGGLRRFASGRRSNSMVDDVA